MRYAAPAHSMATPPIKLHFRLSDTLPLRSYSAGAAAANRGAGYSLIGRCKTAASKATATDVHQSIS